jgi:hypothetical protein
MEVSMSMYECVAKRKENESERAREREKEGERGNKYQW